MRTLEEKIKKLETDLYQNKSSSPGKHAELLALRSQYNELSANKVAANLLKLKQLNYEHGGKSGKILAWRIKQQQTERSINYIEAPNGKNIVNPEEISETFRVYYERLYSSECSSDLDEQTNFLNDLNIPKLSEEESNTYIHTVIQCNRLYASWKNSRP